MSGYVTDVTADVGSFESIYTFRSDGAGAVPKGATNTCDILVTAYNPFDFDIDWRYNEVKYKKKFFLPSGRYVWRNIRRKMPYPFYNFKKNSRSVKEWRHLLSIGNSLMRENKSFNIPRVQKMLKALERKLAKYGPCKPLKVRDSNIQHECDHVKVEFSGNIPVSGAKVTSTTFTGETLLIDNNLYQYTAFNSPVASGQVGKIGNGYYHTSDTFNSQMTSALFSGPLGAITQSNALSTLTAMLWPSSADFEDIQSKPFIDVAEAVSDSTFPLGEPPNPVDAHARMVKSAMSENDFRFVKEAIDFGANSYLWATLVIEPIVSSAIGLAASVKANDMAIEAYTQKAKSGKWHQGKNIRFLGENLEETIDCFGAPREWHFTRDTNAWIESADWEVTYKKLEANASFYYKLDIFDAAAMNSSGVRIGSFLQRMSSDFHTVLHNILPLSFVYDWFSSEYTGILDLKDKVYMPIDDYKLTISYNLDLGVNVKTNTTSIAQAWDKYYNDPPFINMAFMSTDVWAGSEKPVEYKRVFIANGDALRGNEHENETTERHRYYTRKVYKPLRRQDFSDGDLGIECFSNFNVDALDGELGKQITLGALLWGPISSAYDRIYH